MRRARRLAVLLAAAAAAAAAPSALAAQSPPKSAALLIRHEIRGCHSWALNGGPFAVEQVVRLARGGSLTVTNDDVMAQELIEKSGSAVKMRLVRRSHMGTMPTMRMTGKAGPLTMAHMGAQLKVTFAKPGTYRLSLMNRGDYFEVETTGEDHELGLTVVVA